MPQPPLPPPTSSAEILLGHQGSLTLSMKNEIKKRTSGPENLPQPPSKKPKQAPPQKPPPPTDSGSAFDDFMNEIDYVGTPPPAVETSDSAPERDDFVRTEVDDSLAIDQAAYYAKIGALYSLTTASKVEISDDVKERLEEAEEGGEEGDEEEMDFVRIMKKKRKEEKRLKKERKRKEEGEERWRLK
ncbi:hypothetical protein TrST_g6211 [Triparma strigata]|uniref:Uncharacterized protein n=1 Tax=Triparma strigata TaxID=1606541 RepID=A0A9W7BIY9_9STRA|nr:hypothetical protein TrST_g6211 [Triparma strigata]